MSNQRDILAQGFGNMGMMMSELATDLLNIEDGSLMILREGY
jgi:hypothetical protein